MGLSSSRDIVPPTTELELSFVKSYLRIDFSDDDAILTQLIASARERCEAWCNRSFVIRNRVAYYDKITKRFELPRPPVNSISSFTLIYLNETITLTQNQDYYLLDNYNGLGDSFVILTATTYNLPPGFSLGDDLWRFNLQIVYSAGYDTDYPNNKAGSLIPYGVQEAILKTVASAYSLRANVMGTARTGTSGFMELPENAKQLLQPYKNVTI